MVLVHEYLPDRRHDHNECAVCGEDFEAIVHPELGANPVGTSLARTDCRYEHGRWTNGRCLECLRLQVQRKRDRKRQRVALTRGTT